MKMIIALLAFLAIVVGIAVRFAFIGAVVAACAVVAVYTLRALGVAV